MARDAEYGRGHPRFLEYQEFIVEHPSYARMPDVRGVGGDIQWEAPSNRKSGRFRDTYRKRKAWWAEKAREVGIDPSSNQWISRTAKKIHPTGNKPCKVCGRVMDTGFAYQTWHIPWETRQQDDALTQNTRGRCRLGNDLQRSQHCLPSILAWRLRATRPRESCSGGAGPTPDSGGARYHHSRGRRRTTGGSD
jgi:hypothetical protein